MRYNLKDVFLCLFQASIKCVLEVATAHIAFEAFFQWYRLLWEEEGREDRPSTQVWRKASSLSRQAGLRQCLGKLLVLH